MTPPEKSSEKALDYRDSGVSIDAGADLVERIKPLAARTRRDGVVEGLGGFGALFELAKDKYENPVLVSGTDGVGTKLKLATQLGRHDSVGIDLVAMCVNDIVVCGAEPLFFLDYFATGQLDVEQAASVVGGIARGCELAGCALIGGESAEMPGMYAPGDYDLAGFAVGVVEKSAIITPDQVRPGNTLLGLASSGPHSNGFSLIRKILERSGADPAQPFGDSTLGETLLTPTRIYVKSLLRLLGEIEVNAISHITGGGILENLPRVLPDNLRAVVSRSAFSVPDIFQWIREHGAVQEREMLRTFNCGLGMILCVNAHEAGRATHILEDAGERVFAIGEVIGGEPGVELAD